MAEVSMSFCIKADKEIIGAIKSALSAIENEMDYFFSVSSNEEGTAYYANVESLGLWELVSWITNFQVILKEYYEKEFIFTVNGTADNDYDSYTEFEIKCTESMISKKEYDYEIPFDDDYDAYDDLRCDMEKEAEEALNNIEEEPVTDEYFDSENYEVFKQAIDLYFNGITMQ